MDPPRQPDLICFASLGCTETQGPANPQTQVHLIVQPAPPEPAKKRPLAKHESQEANRAMKSVTRKVRGRGMHTTPEGRAKKNTFSRATATLSKNTKKPEARPKIPKLVFEISSVAGVLGFCCSKAETKNAGDRGRFRNHLFWR